MLVARIFRRALLFGVARSEYCTSTAAAGGSFTSTKTTHNPLEEFFELDRNLEDEKPIVYVRSCVYIDSDSGGSRCSRSIDTSRIRFAHPDLPERLSTTLGIKKLSDVVVEELDNEEQLQTLDKIGSVSLVEVKMKLSSKSFHATIYALANCITSSMPSFSVHTLEQVQISLVPVAETLQFVLCLHTRFMLLPKYLDITILDVLAVVVSQVLGSPISLPIGSLLSVPRVQRKGFSAPSLKPGSYRSEIGNRDELAGKELLPQDALQVQFHPLRPFYRGEIVAWKTGNDGDKLKYGRVPGNVRPFAGQALYRFMDEIAPRDAEFLVSSQTQPSKELQYGRVSIAELVQAVHGMLSAAGINMDVEK
ncbi:hypothetical protein GIB67_004074 [Kingdonia uniflora]|uniref:Uncharacterized protein n=1 Tax=Kingdonia uniflora TaxID=39325 RepID=A0A7J7NRT9_9MAGN|nr:hypothetical protein GIB67_004074 [Kingdonia uniflora]